MALAAIAAVTFSACSASPNPKPEPDDTPTSAGATEKGSEDALVVTTAALPDTIVLAGQSSAELAQQTAHALFDSSPVVVIAAVGEELRGASAAAALGVPVLVDDEQTASGLERLGAQVALAIGHITDPGIDVIVPTDDAGLAMLIGAGSTPGTGIGAGEYASALANLDGAAPQLLIPSEPNASTSPTTTPQAGGPLESDRDELPAVQRAEPATDVVVMSTGADRDTAAIGTALASGATVMIVPTGDPRAASSSVETLAAGNLPVAVGLGQEFVDAETLAWRTQSAASGIELPGGGQLVLPGKTYVALYGHPGTAGLGVLGEQDAEATIKRAASVASEYESLTEQPVVPALEIIATVASGEAGKDGNYSNEVAPARLRELVDLAGKNGQYVVIDLQPGRTDFLTQAKLYQELLELPHVGLALDPEWRIGPNQVHLRQIGHVEVSEVNQVVTWLADLTREKSLPQKMLILHQFQVQMLRDVNSVDQSRSEVAVLIHVDGQGPQPTKQTTWRTLHANAPAVKSWGWKNFYDEDIPGPLSPADTMSKVDPIPDFISYQ